VEFQSTPPRGGDWARAVPMCTSASFQSTPPRGGDPGPPEKTIPDTVSIHAPARGRQSGLQYTLQTARFQSTPPRGGDPWWCTATFPAPSFNPRPREGATDVRRARGRGHGVSIHAPARGRPAHPRSRLRRDMVSIHAPARGRPCAARC